MPARKKRLNIAQPDFYPRFFCIGAACEDICCSGMGVVIDKPTFDKYQNCDDPTMGPLLKLNVLPNPTSANQASFASVTLDGPACPFLQPDNNCTIQINLGEEYLSRTCDTYPRAFSMVDNVLERSLYLSCPEAARIILLRSSEIRFNIPGEGRHDKYTDFPTVDTSDELFGGKPYKHFGLIRNFIMHLLRNRRYKVWERMVILGMYCDQVSRIPEAELLDGTPVLTESFTEHLLHKRFDQTLSGVVPNSSLPLNVVINTIEDRIKSDYTSPRFVECYRQSLEGLGYCAGTDLQTLCENFMTYQRDYYEPYFASREYIWENYLVSKVYKDLFPFGAQKAVYHNPRTIYQEYILLAAQYIFARTLMVGLIAYGKSNFSSTDVVRLIQSLSRATEHDASFMSKLLRSLEQAKITELATFATMVKI